MSTMILPDAEAGVCLNSDNADQRRAWLARAIEHAAHLLPAQGPINVFIHHNTLHAFEELMRSGAVRTFAELAELGHVWPARITQLMNLLLLAPEIQERLLFLPLVERGAIRWC